MAKKHMFARGGAFVSIVTDINYYEDLWYKHNRHIRIDGRWLKKMPPTSLNNLSCCDWDSFSRVRQIETDFNFCNFASVKKIKTLKHAEKHSKIDGESYFLWNWILLTLFQFWVFHISQLYCTFFHWMCCHERFNFFCAMSLCDMHKTRIQFI